MWSSSGRQSSSSNTALSSIEILYPRHMLNTSGSCFSLGLGSNTILFTSRRLRFSFHMLNGLTLYFLPSSGITQNLYFSYWQVMVAFLNVLKMCSSFLSLFINSWMYSPVARLKQRCLFNSLVSPSSPLCSYSAWYMFRGLSLSAINLSVFHPQGS